MIQGNLFTGVFELASQFPPSVNTEDDPATLKPYESPACYGVSSTSEGRLRTGSIPTGTARTAPTKTVSGSTYYWYYNRLWSLGTSILTYGAPWYDDVFFPHGLGKFQFGDGGTMLGLMPAFQSQLWALSSTGSYFITNAKSMGEEDFEGTQFIQELKAPALANALTLNGMPIVSNATGVFMWDGNSLKELTKPVRSSLGSFTTANLTADYQTQKIVGGTSFAIDVRNGKLFDYGTSGFLYTTKTMAQPKGYGPFTVNSLIISFELSSGTTGTISWQSKTEDGDWFSEEDIEIVEGGGTNSRAEMQLANPDRTAHKMAFRITALSSNISIRAIQVNVVGMAVESGGE